MVIFYYKQHFRFILKDCVIWLYIDLIWVQILLFATFLLSLNLFSLSLKVCLYTLLKLKQYSKTSEGKFRKITLYYTNISFCRIRVLGLFVVDVAIGAASQWQSEASL